MRPATAEHRAEIVVIGSGPGGSTTAHLLAEHGRDVLILEEGAHLPLESCEPFSAEEMLQKYRAGGLNPTIGNAKVVFAEGRCAGGGSEINSGLYHRTPPDMLERWQRDFRVQNTSADEMLPHFRYCEEALHVGVCPSGTPAASRKLQEGADQLGWAAIEVPRWFKFDNGSDRGTRQSMTKTFLPRAIGAGARLMPLTRARRLVRAGRGWSVEAIREGAPIRIRADAVFVCGGALQTPLLLRRSGITRNAGNSLALHPTVKVIALFDEEVNHENLGVPVHQVKEFAPRMSFGCSISAPPHLAMALLEYDGYHRIIKENWRRMAIYYAMITGSNTGRIRPVFGSPDPLIRYSLSDADLRDLATAMRRLSQLLLRAGAKALYPAIAGGRVIHSEEELSTIPASLPPARANMMTIHLFSSCPMGEDLNRCAADSMGRIHDAENLFVNDASLIPTAPGVNPQGTIMALARRNTLHFLGRL